MFSTPVESTGSPPAGVEADDLLKAQRGLILVPVVRDKKVLGPENVGALRVGDRLILASDDRAYTGFVCTQCGGPSSNRD
ncbi:MAG: hypothetical protein HYW08_15300 [candidate division NC10 bacterium]|nr:hypothetical protein [candidate division NC10 bacterium]